MYPGGRFFKTCGAGDLGRKAAQLLDGDLAKREIEGKYSFAVDRALGDAFEALLLEKRIRIKGRSLSTYEFRIQRLMSLYGDRPLRGTGKEVVADLQEYLTNHDAASPKTINGYTTLLNEAVKLAVDRGWIDANPLSGYQRMKEGSPLETWRALTDEEIARVVEAAPDDWFGDVILVLLNTGMRTGEVQQMTWDCIEKDTMVVRSDASKSTVSRRLPINAEMARILEKNRERGTGVPFPGKRPGEPYPKSSLDNRWQLLRKRIGIPHRLHDMRHTYACRLAAAGVNPLTAQYLLGHTNLETTLIYYRLTEEQKIAEGRMLSCLSKSKD